MAQVSEMLRIQGPGGESGVLAGLQRLREIRALSGFSFDSFLEVSRAVGFWFRVWVSGC